MTALSNGVVVPALGERGRHGLAGVGGHVVAGNGGVAFDHLGRGFRVVDWSESNAHVLTTLHLLELVFGLVNHGLVEG